ncbi:hypothetical protein MNB_SV-15-1011 [hydrothermal vent metagenome]|uniref:Uncharacterized protein n=1 Tax=hydrothermal vent metagenome TaxID=652676 RepID=A0A1W1ELK0_9ZZZZ
MNQDKYIIGELEIQKGIEDESLKRDGTLIRNVKNGQIVKILKEDYLEKSSIPSTLVQLNNTYNTNYIYQIDIKPIIETIIKIKNNEIFDELDEKYKIILEYLEHYKTHGDYISELNQNCLEGASIFEKRILDFIDSNDKELINDIDKISDYNQFINMLQTYINLLFVYMLSTFWKYKEKALNDTIIIKKIETIENKILNLYEQVLVCSDKDNKVTIIPNISDSLYMKYIVKEDYDIQDIEKFIKYDRRFDSFIDLFSFIKKVKIKNIDTNNKNRYKNNRKLETNIQFEKKNNTNPKNPKKDLVNDLFDILENLQRLKNIREEIININDNDLSNEELPFYNNESNKSFLLALKQ